MALRASTNTGMAPGASDLDHRPRRPPTPARNPQSRESLSTRPAGWPAGQAGAMPRPSRARPSVWGLRIEDNPQWTKTISPYKEKC